MVMLKKVKGIANKPFIKNVFLLATGTAAAQIITLLASPIITRIYGPEAFGILGVFNALIMILGPIAALTYPIAIVLPKKNEEAISIVKISLRLTLLLAILALIIICFFNEKLVSLFNLTEIKSFMFLLPIVLLFSGLAQVSEQWLIRTRQFKVNAKTTVLQAIIINLSKILIGLGKPLGAVLIIIQSCSNGLKTILYHNFSKRDLYSQVKQHGKDSLSKQKKIAKKYYDFPLYRSPQVLLNGVSMSLPILMLTSFYGPAAAGFFTLSRTVLSAPTQLIGKSVGDVFYPRITKAANDGEDVTALIIKASLSLFVIGIIPFGLIILFGPYIFTVIFGDEWTIAGEYAKWITIWVFLGFVNRPSVMTLPVLNAQVFHLIFTVTMLISNASMLLVGYYYFDDDLISVMLVGISGGVFSLLLILMTIYLSKTRKGKRT